MSLLLTEFDNDSKADEFNAILQEKLDL